MTVCDESCIEHAIKFRIYRVSQKYLNFIKIKRIGPQQNIAALQNHKCCWNNTHSMKNDSVQLMQKISISIAKTLEMTVKEKVFKHSSLHKRLCILCKRFITMTVTLFKLMLNAHTMLFFVWILHRCVSCYACNS